MEFRILGPLEVVGGNRSIQLGGPKQRAVLAALLVEANHVVPLDRLLDRLWGDEPPARATASLQTYVSNLRRVLEPERPPRAPASVLVTQPPGYVLRIDADQTDFLRFEAAAARGRALLEDGRARAARDSFAEGLALWRGPALGDLIHEPFQTVATRLEELRLAVIEDLMEADLALGQHAAAVPELENLVEEHPYRERLWQLLMLALYRCGRQAEALRALHRARTILSEELGIDPGPALQQLEAEILRQSPSLEWVPASGERAAAPMASGAGAPAPVPSPDPGRLPLVGREVQLAQIVERYEEVLRGTGRLLLLSGEAGVGKTRLAEEAIHGLTSRHRLHVAWGSCHEGEAVPAFWPWVQVFRALKRARGPGDSSDPRASDLTSLLWDADPSADEFEELARGDPAAARAALYDTASRALVDLASRDPLIIVIDDLHWADRPSLELLEFLAPQIAHERLLIVGLYRDAEVPMEDPWAQTLGALAREPVVTRLALGGLSSDDVGALLHEASGTEMASELVESVHRRTEGNPFFVSELARLLESEGAPAVLEQGIPQGVRDVLRRRLTRLPEKTVTVLTTASVIGSEFDFPLLERVCGLPEESALDHVEAALMTGLITDSEERLGRYRFSHDLLRETLSAELSAVRRARLHARIASEIETLYGSEHAERAIEIAAHMWDGRLYIAPARVASALVRGADVALAQLDYDHAQVQLERGAELVETLDEGGERARLELDVHLRLGQLLLMTRGYAAPPTGRAFDAARRAGAALSEARDAMVVLFGSFFFAIVRSELSLALEIADQLLELGARTSDPATRMLGHQASGLTCWLRGRLREADEHLSSSISLADGLDPTRVAPLRTDFRVSARSFRSIVAALIGLRLEAERLSAEAFELTQQLDDAYTSATFFFFDALEASIIGDLDRAEARSTAGVELSTGRGYRLFAATSAVFAGWAQAAARDPVLGARQIRDAEEAVRATGATMLQHFTLALLADAELRAGHIDEALRACEAGLAESARTGDRFFEPELHRLRGEAILKRSAARKPEAQKAFERAILGAREQGSGLLESRARASAGRIEVPH